MFNLNEKIKEHLDNSVVVSVKKCCGYQFLVILPELATCADLYRNVKLEYMYVDDMEPRLFCHRSDINEDNHDIKVTLPHSYKVRHKHEELIPNSYNFPLKEYLLDKKLKPITDASQTIVYEIFVEFSYIK